MQIRRAMLRLALCAIAAAPAALSAQQKLPWELGVDGGVFRSWYRDDPNRSSLTRVELPIAAFRVALPLNQHFALEPAAGFTRNGSDLGSSSIFALDVALLVELSQDRAAPRWFVRPFVGLQRTSFGGNADSRSTLGVGAGVRVPATDRISTRFEARYRYLPDGAVVSGNVIGLLAGLSVFTR
jgi:hypothetical protein